MMLQKPIDEVHLPQNSGLQTDMAQGCEIYTKVVMRLKRATLKKPAISHKLGLYSRVFCISITHFFKIKLKLLLMARSVIQSVIFVASQQCRKLTCQRIPKENPDFLRKK